MVSTYRVAVLGARGVGKSAIVRQFLYNEFSEACVPTTARRLYLPAVVMNGHVHDLQILDFPPISTFPVNTLQVRGPRTCWGSRLGSQGDGSGWWARVGWGEAGLPPFLGSGPVPILWLQGLRAAPRAILLRADIWVPLYSTCMS